jgi:phosphoribosyl 1,2-cyclic phosphodiesterase
MRCSTDIVFHGARGSAPAGGVDYSEFGGDTPAIEIVNSGARLFLDAGSGLRNADAGGGGRDIDIILSHYHFDHLIGLPFFDPVWKSRGRLRIWAPKLGGRDPRTVLQDFYALPYCPVGLADFAMPTEVIPFQPGDRWTLDGEIAVSTMLAEHPGGSAAIRINTRSGDVVYASDVETADGGAAALLVAFAAGADLLIIDAMNDDGNAAARRGWGHSSWRQALSIGQRAGARSIGLFHHDPRATDNRLRRIEFEAAEMDARAFLVKQASKMRLNAGG